MTAVLTDDKSAATIHLLIGAKPATQIELQASELDAVVAMLGEARAVMRDQVSYETPEARSARELMVLNPTWRAEPQPHPSLAGVILRLRHPGFGWLTFLLPHHEARSLGDWLTKLAQPAHDIAQPEEKVQQETGEI